MVPFFYLGHTIAIKAVIPTPGLFIERKYAVSFNNLCRECREPDLYCINKKTGIPTHKIKKRKKKKEKKKRQQQPATHWHTHAKETMKKLVFPTLTIPPALGPEALYFSCRLPRGRIVANKKEQGF